MKLCTLLYQNTVSYEHAGDRRPCCISGGRFHQSCLCGGPISECKSECDKDNECKGYVALVLEKPKEACLFATSSTCPTECTLQNYGNIGPLLVNETCGEKNDEWGGCHIKENQGICIVAL